MSAAYTVHVGPRAEEWPRQVTEAPTRGEAQQLCKHFLSLAPDDVTKGEVRRHALLLDCYGKRATGTIRHTYAAKQRGEGQA